MWSMKRWKIMFIDRHRWWESRIYAHGHLLGVLILPHKRFRELTRFASLAGVEYEVKTNRSPEFL